MEEPKVNEVFAGNGEHSHYELLNDNGVVLWSEITDEANTISNLVADLSSFKRIVLYLEKVHEMLELDFDNQEEKEKDQISEIVKMCESISDDYWMYKRRE
jgi:hypothetical protein